MSLTLIIGLPGSGKTTLGRSLPGIYFDDFIQTMYDGRLYEAILNGHDVVASDPRLCNFRTFKKVVSHFTKVKLILFKNNTHRCYTNCLIRGNMPQIKHDIDFWSDLYEIDNYT